MLSTYRYRSGIRLYVEKEVSVRKADAKPRTQSTFYKAELFSLFRLSNGILASNGEKKEI